MSAAYRHVAFGALWCADVPLPQFDVYDTVRDRDVDPHPIVVRRVEVLADRAGEGQVYRDGLRFSWRDEVTFDLYHGERIDYLPGLGWTGVMPDAFASTLAALTLAWRGALPIHASAIELAGQALLILGKAGAGKSTLAAELLHRGATLISDDLSVVTQEGPNAPFRVERGRPTIRLHADAAARLPSIACAPVLGDDRGKWLARPIARSPYRATPLAGIIVLGAPDGRLGQREALTVGTHLFRPRWLRFLPGHAERLRAVFTIAEQVPCYGVARTGVFHNDPAAVAEARAIIAAVTGT